MREDIVMKATESNGEPLPDIAQCSECGWEGHVSECETEQEGSQEEGYYQAHVCPKCDDGGCIDDYSMSNERADEWEKWNAERQAKEVPTANSAEVSSWLTQQL